MKNFQQSPDVAFSAAVVVEANVVVGAVEMVMSEISVRKNHLVTNSHHNRLSKIWKKIRDSRKMTEQC